jgi:ketosteroid isomerase-like protein
MLSGPAANRQHAETLASGAVSDPGASEMTDDERAIRQVVDTWMAASKSGDLATVLSLMTDDVIFTVPGQEPFGKIAGSSEILELRVLGDWAFIRNRIEMKVTPLGANPIRRSGYTLTLLRKEANGKWRLARDANLLTTQS